jgi:hypothetical protein
VHSLYAETTSITRHALMPWTLGNVCLFGAVEEPGM